jgi:hypothetical protein
MGVRITDVEMVLTVDEKIVAAAHWSPHAPRCARARVVIGPPVRRFSCALAAWTRRVFAEQQVQVVHAFVAGRSARLTVTLVLRSCWPAC